MTCSERRVVIFDMDGTLTRPTLDFDRIREEIGIPGAAPILEAMVHMSPAHRKHAEAILDRHEAEAAANSELRAGAAAVVAAVRVGGIATALMTRNSRRSVESLRARHGLSFDMIWTREDGSMKPSPAPILAICGALGCNPRDAWTIGDNRYDIICGAGAGATTVLLDAETKHPAWAHEADHVVHELVELLSLLKIEG